MENVKKFMEEVEQNLELQGKLVELGKVYQGDPMDLDAVIRQSILPVAEEMNLPFTAEDYKEYLAKQAKNRALSEDELDQVVGGIRDVDCSGSDVKNDITIIDESINIYIVMPGASPDAVKEILR